MIPGVFRGEWRVLERDPGWAILTAGSFRVRLRGRAILVAIRLPLPMTTPSDGRKRSAGPVVAVLLALAVPLTVFLPLVFALIEHMLFGSRHVEQFFRAVGLHDELEAIYDPVISFLSNLWP